MDKEIDRKIDVTAILFPLVQNGQKTHVWNLIGSGTNGLGKKEWIIKDEKLFDLIFRFSGATRTFIRGEGGGEIFSRNKIKNTGCVTGVICIYAAWNLGRNKKMLI